MNRAQGITITVALAVGALAAAAHCWAYPELSVVAWPAVIVVSVALLGMVAVRPLRNAFVRVADQLNEPRMPARLVGCIGVFVLAACYLWINAVLHDRDLTPRSHDENSYQIQARMMARGRLWMPALPEPLPDFVESFHLLVRPVYASIYFPGTALVHVPAVWLRVPPWVPAILITAAAAAVLFLVGTELIGAGYGLVGALMLIATPRVRWISTTVLSHPPATLAGLLILWTWVRWRRSRSAGASIAIGAALGWSAIVRPFDLLAYAVPIGVLFLLDARAHSMGQTSRAALLVALAAAPFLCLQLALNKGTTNDWFTTPYRSYIDQYQPGSALGLRTSPPSGERPHTTLAQKLDVYDEWLRPQIDAHRLDNLWSLLMDYRIMWVTPAVLPNALLLTLVPVGIVAAVLSHDGLKVVIAIVPFLFMALYLLNPYFVQHYPVVVAPAVILTAVFGLRSVVELVSPLSSGYARSIPVGLALAMTLSALPEMTLHFTGPEDDGMNSPGAIDRLVNEQTRKPAVVLFRYQRGDYVHVEPVYNYDVAWPLDAPVLRAHDLGIERDPEIFRWFADHDSQRTFYLFDRRTMRLYSLGRAGDWQNWFSPARRGKR